MNQDVDRFLFFGYSVKLKQQQKILEAVVIVKFTSAAILQTLLTVSLEQVADLSLKDYFTAKCSLKMRGKWTWTASPRPLNVVKW